MNTVKKAISLLLVITMLSLAPFSAIASTTQATQNSNEIQPYYVNIFTVGLSRGNTWVYADMEAFSKMSLRTDVKIYKNGKLDFSDYATANDMFCELDVGYDFESGVAYRINATYKAGTETVPKSMSFTQK